MWTAPWSTVMLETKYLRLSTAVTLGSRFGANRAQVQPTTGPKWAFGKVLREYRERNGISQEQLAEAAGLDRSFISLVERGIQSPNIVVLLKLAEVLDVPAAELIAKMESAIRKPR